MMEFVELENNSGLVDVGSNSIVTEWKTSAVHEYGHIYLYPQLGQLQQYRQATAKNLRSAAQELRATKVLTYMVASPTVFTLVDRVAVRIAGCGPVDVSSPSLHLPCAQTVGIRFKVYEEFCDLVAEAARESLARFWRYKRELRRVTAVIAILQKAARSTISFFCSVPWERRRWFLRHGARPPKPVAQVMPSLFATACSRPLIAY